MLMMDFITMAGLGGYWRRWPGPTCCDAQVKRDSNQILFGDILLTHDPLLSQCCTKTPLYLLRQPAAQCTKIMQLYPTTREEIGSLDSLDCCVADHMSQCPGS